MSERTYRQRLRSLGLVSGLLCLLAGCGGNSGSSDQSGAGSRVGQLSLQLQLAPQVSPSQPAGLAATQGRQAQPGDPGFIERLEVRLQAQGNDLVPPQVFPLSPAEQESVTRDVTVPDTAPATFEVLVSSFTHEGIEAFRGNTTVARGQASAVVPLVRAALVPVPATPDDLTHRTFQFPDGTVFGLANAPVTLAAGTFVGNVGDFAIGTQGFVAIGNVVIGSCTFIVTTSSFPLGEGLQVGARIVFDPCLVDAIDKRLIATNVAISAAPTTAISSPPVLAPPEETLNLPSALLLVTDEDTFAMAQIAVTVSSTRPRLTAFAITTPPAHGTATITDTGRVTYQPVADFNGSDLLVVTVIVHFTDNNVPPLILGTLPVGVTVRPVNDTPVVTNPGNQTTAEGTAVVLQIVAQDVDSNQLSVSVSTQPAHGIATVTPSGLATYTPTPGFTGPDSFTVTVTDNGTPPLAGTVVVPVTVTAPPNRAPVPTAPAISTPQNTAGSSQVSANDPDVGQSFTFSVSTAPAHGTAAVNASGLATYTPTPGYTGPDSFAVTVTDNGTPPLAGTVPIAVTVTAPPNRAPVPTAPAISTPQNTAGSSQVSANDPDVGQSFTFSVSTAPAHGTATVNASGLATYTPTAGFTGPDSFVVTVADNGTPPLSAPVTIPIMVLILNPSNNPPLPTAPPITTTTATADTSQIAPNDPDAGQSQTFTFVTSPTHGTAIVSTMGLVTYTPDAGFTGTDSLVIRVTDSGSPSLFGDVTIPITVNLPSLRGIVVTPDGNFAYVADFGANSVVRVNLPNKALAQRIRAVGDGPQQVALAPTSNEVFVSNFTGNTIAIINALSNTVVATLNTNPQPDGIVFTSGGARAYVAHNGSNNVTVIDTTLQTIPLGKASAQLALTPNDQHVYVTNFSANTVTVIATSTNTVTTTIPVGNQPEGIAILSTGQFAYVGNSLDGTVSVIDLSSNTVVKTIPVGMKPWRVTASPDDSVVLTTNQDDNSVTIIHTSSNTAVDCKPNVAGFQSCDVGSSPWQAAFAPDSKTAFITNRMDNTISVFDLASQTVTAVIFIGNPLPTTVIGKVVNENQVALADLTVTTNGGLTGVTASDGSFSIPNVPTTLGKIAASAVFIAPDGVISTGTSTQFNPVFGGTTNVGTILIHTSNPQDTVTLASAPFAIPAGFDRLELTFNFLSNEFPTFVGGSFNDTAFSVVRTNSTPVANRVLASVNLSSFVKANNPASNSGFNGQTGFQKATLDVSSVAGSGTSVVLVLGIRDEGDSTLDSAVLIDNIELVNSATGSVQLIPNGNFETGHLDSFTASFITKNSGSPPTAGVISSVGVIPPPEGSFMLYLATGKDAVPGFVHVPPGELIFGQ